MSQDKKNAKYGIIIGLAIVLPIFLWVMITIISLINEGRAIYLCNPHENVLNLEIGPERYSLQPGENRKIDISKGEYKVKSYLGEKVILDTSIAVTRLITQKGGLINLSGEPLYRWTEYYGSPPIEAIYTMPGLDSRVKSPLQQAHAQSSRFFQIDSTILYGIVDEYDGHDLVLVKVWDYNLDESFKEEVISNGHYEVVLGKPMSKLFYKQGLLRYWQENYEMIFDTTVNHTDSVDVAD